MSDVENVAAEKGIAFTSLAPDNVAEFAARPVPDKPLGSPIAAGKVRLRLGPGDVLRVQMFETSTTVRAGEYTVLGASGLDPAFVVLHVVEI